MEGGKIMQDLHEEDSVEALKSLQTQRKQRPWLHAVPRLRDVPNAVAREERPYHAGLRSRFMREIGARMTNDECWRKLRQYLPLGHGVQDPKD